MFDRVIFVCDANMDIIESVPALEDSYTAFKLRVVADKALMQQVSNEENGYAEAKDSVWEDLAEALDSMCAGLRVYAKKQGNIELRAQAKFTKTSFLQTRGSDAIAMANNRLTLLNAHVANLSNYNVTPAKVTAATTMLGQLEVLNPKPTGQRSVDKAIRKSLVKRVKETTIVLDQEIDDLMLTLTATEPLFVAQYFNARRIQRTGIRHEKPEGDPEAMNLNHKEGHPPQPKEALNPDTTALPDDTATDTGHSATNGASPPDNAPSIGEGQAEG